MPTSFFEINGIRVANIKNYSENAFFGIGVMAGSNYETPDMAGVSHFAEHIFFKGTKTRNWNQLNQDFAKLGIDQNAYTSNNEVLYHSTFPLINSEKSIELIMDIFFNSIFPEEEIEKERNVILEEKKACEDNPQSYLYSKLDRLFDWQIGHDTIGEFETINKINRNDIINYLHGKINKNTFTFIFCGNMEDNELKKHIEKNIPSGHVFLNDGSLPDHPQRFWSSIIDSDSRIKIIETKLDIQQAFILRITQGISSHDSRIYSYRVIVDALGGGMYSRLFTKLREELGLCYSTGAWCMAMAYPDKSVLTSYAMLSPDNVDILMEETEKIIIDFRKNGIGQDLFECAKNSYLSSFIMGSETSRGKAISLASHYTYGHEKTIDDVINGIQKVTIKDCNKIMDEMFGQKTGWALLKPA
jgi:predicted Zn-dependent peptidase